MLYWRSARCAYINTRKSASATEWKMYGVNRERENVLDSFVCLDILSYVTWFWCIYMHEEIPNSYEKRLGGLWGITFCAHLFVYKMR